MPESVANGECGSFVLQGTQKGLLSCRKKLTLALALQVFGKLILDEVAPLDASEGGARKDDASGVGSAGDGALSEGDVDLKEHMVGILFSRSKLTHLQKQVRTAHEQSSLLSLTLVRKVAHVQNADCVR